MIRWAMRPVNEEGKFTIATDVKDGKVRVVVTALDKNDEFLNFLNMSAAGSGPEMENIEMHVPAGSPRPVCGRVSSRQGGQLPAGDQHRPGKCHAADRRDGALFGRIPRARDRTRPC